MSIQSTDKLVRGADLVTIGEQIKSQLGTKQSTLVSGVNIKTINETSILGEGDIIIEKGEDGASAYDIWLEEGHTGSESDFLASLKGETGPSGVTGDVDGMLVDNLTTNDGTKILSAKQGYILDGKVSQLVQKVDDLHDIKDQEISAGMINGYTANYAQGRLHAGGEVKTDSASEGWYYSTVYIPVEPGDTVVWRSGISSNDYSGKFTLCYYDTDKEYVNYKNAQKTDRTETIPSDVYYVRCSFRKTDSNGAANTIPLKVNGENSFIWVDGVPGIGTIQEEIGLTGNNIDYLKQVTSVVTPEWELGNISISGSGWSYSSSTSRVRLKQGTILHLYKGDAIGLSSYTDACFYVGWRRADGTYGYNATWLTKDYVATVDGDYVILIRNITEETQTSADALSSLFVDRGQSVQRQRFVGGIPGISNSYINYDTKAQSVTIPRDIVILDGTNTIAPNGSEAVVIDISGISSSAVKVMYDKSTGEFVAAAYTATTNSYTRLFIAAIRKHQNAYPDSGGVSSLYPWSIDGKPYGIDAQLNRGFVKGVNHRGLNGTYPENTLPAFIGSAKAGFKYVETDVQFTSDGVAVLLHDNSINRTARNSDGTPLSSTVNIADITYEEALEYDFGIWKGEEFAGTKIPTLTEFLALCRNLGLCPYIELKVGTSSQIAQLVDMTMQYNMQDKCTWISFLSSLLGYVSAEYGKARLGYVVSSVTSSTVANAIGLKNGTNEVFIDSSTRTSAEILLCKNANIPLEVWTIDSASTIKALDRYISGVTSNSQDASRLLYISTMG